IEPRSPGVVLEPRERQPLSGLELALDQHVADHPALAGDCLEGQETDTRHVLAVKAAVAASEELVAAADRKHRGALPDGLLQLLRLLDEIPCDEELLSILSAANVVEVVLAGHDAVVHPQRRHLELVTTPRGPALEHGDVAAVGVDVEVV